MKSNRLIMMNGGWLDADDLLKLLTKTIHAAYDTGSITGKEYLIMEDFRTEMISEFGDEEVGYENCD